ncbi:MAG: 4-hydroxy-3-methylbut-2-enyl diphosphate reductase [Ignavibacteriota bacterium]|nr:4-hydroxy-3-methylbut-2-enyl diphosphate reductase [Ignavibacteriota bacterium]
MKKFEIPVFYRSPLITKIKKLRDAKDPRKKDYLPTSLNFGPVEFLIARHFGFCYGVENAIEISYKAIEENTDKRIFLLSEMIHNPEVNGDLISRGVKFISDTNGKQLIEWGELKSDDIVIIPAFGTTVEIQQKLYELGIEAIKYDTTCPFVEKVWNRAASLGKSDFTVIVHGKHKHEETRATFSHSKENAPTIIVRNIEEAQILGKYILGETNEKVFNEYFRDKLSPGFNIKKHLSKVGVVNQTTMLASETQAISDYLKNIMTLKFGEENIKEHIADTRDTLCYATHDNQRATLSLLELAADLAIVVGGYNSSNTSHIVELCEERLPTYFISSADKMESKTIIRHFKFAEGVEQTTNNYLPQKEKVKIILTSGASCPDAVVDEVLTKTLSFFKDVRNAEEVINEYESGL